MNAQVFSQEQVDAFFTLEALEDLRNSPGFRSAMDGMGRDCVEFFTSLDPAGLWLVSDLGRTSIYLAALILDSMPGGLTMTALNAATMFSAYSRGRVGDFMERAIATGEIVVPTGYELWTQRRLIIRPAFVARMRRRSLIDLRAAARIDPTLRVPNDAFDDDALYRRFLFWLGVMSTKERVASTEMTPTRLFIHRHGGGRVLMHLLAQQPPERERLLESALLSRSALAKACNVSRPHINRMMADAEAEGLVSFPSRSVIRIEPKLSDDYERTLAFIVQMFRGAYLAALQTAER